MAKEATKAAKQASYNLEVQETKVCLAEELAEVCKDYCQEVQAKALNQARVLAASKWRKAKNIYYPPNIRKVPAALPSLVAPTLSSSKQPSTTQASLPPLEVHKGPSKASDQG